MQIRTIMGTILFFLLIVRGIYYINKPNQPRRQDYTDGWNLLMIEMNQLQKLVLGEIKVDTQQLFLNGVPQQQIFVRNMGVVYIVSSGAALSKSSVIRLTALFGLLTLSFLFGRAKTTGLSYEDLLEKYQHLLLGVLVGLFILTEPRTWNESRKDNIVKGYLENYRQNMENKRRLDQKIEGSKDETTQEKVQDLLKKIKKEEQSNEERERQMELEREERVRKAQELEEKLREQDKEEEDNLRIEYEQEEEEEQQQKAKFQLDEDGFSIIPKKHTKKVQGENTNVSKQKKKQHNDI